MKRVLSVIGLFLFVSCWAFAQHTVTLSCTASTSSGVSSYNIWRAPCSDATISAGVCSAIGEGTFVKIGSSPSCSFVDSSVSATQKLAYFVTAVCPTTCATSESDPSNHIAVTIPKDGKPNPPTGLGVTTVSKNNSPNGKQSQVLAAWVDVPDVDTTFKLTAKRHILWWNLQGTLASGNRPGNENGGPYSVGWTGSKIDSANLTVCDIHGCVSKSSN